MEGVLGFTMLFAGDFAPRGWAFCDGSLVRISSNLKLFSIIGTTYGGDGKKTFALPDLRGRVVVGVGKGISEYKLNDRGGSESPLQLGTQHMPAHTHPVQVTITPRAAGVANSITPVQAVYATNPNHQMYAPSGDTAMASYIGTMATAATGSDDPQPIPVLHPVLALNYIICLVGVFPHKDH